MGRTFVQLVLLTCVGVYSYVGELLPPSFQLSSWDNNTLVAPDFQASDDKEGWLVYDQLSDMYQLGVAISPYVNMGYCYSLEMVQLLQGLISRQWTADAVLKAWQEWFVRCAVS